MRNTSFTVGTCRISLLGLLFALSGQLHAHDVPAQDAVAVAAQHHKLLLENDAVRVLETRIRPGERTAVHAHPWPSSLYVVSWSDFVRYDPDGKVLVDSRTMTTKPQPGSALWSPPVPAHYIVNVGATELLVIAVELKPK
jgi:quercetin dioxygenase-like cupin family protein